MIVTGGSNNNKNSAPEVKKEKTNLPPPKKVRDAQTNKGVEVSELLYDSDAEDEGDATNGARLGKS
jgi:hypothetical protein